MATKVKNQPPAKFIRDLSPDEFTRGVKDMQAAKDEQDNAEDPRRGVRGAKGYAAGGMVRGDGIARKGKTRGKVC